MIVQGLVGDSWVGVVLIWKTVRFLRLCHKFCCNVKCFWGYVTKKQLIELKNNLPTPQPPCWLLRQLEAIPELFEVVQLDSWRWWWWPQVEESLWKSFLSHSTTCLAWNVESLTIIISRSFDEKIIQLQRLLFILWTQQVDDWGKLGFVISRKLMFISPDISERHY